MMGWRSGSSRTWAKSLLPFCASLILIGAVSPPSVTPRIEGRTLDQSSFSLADMRGNVVVINFWATWCAPCRAEMPALDSYYLAHRSAGLRMIAISMDDPGKGQAVATVAATFHFPVAMARDTRLPTNLRPTQLPATLVFDRGGVLRFDSRRTGNGLMDAPALNRIVGPLLIEAAGR
jgi:cytochrome c biogenesis protein CcmG, thiol:disulfide interchange protein DsbE